MDHPELHTHSFIVKIWLEETGTEARGATWRGHVTHVPSGERRYLTELVEITDFVTHYLERAGVKFSPWQRLWNWLKR